MTAQDEKRERDEHKMMHEMKSARQKNCWQRLFSDFFWFKCVQFRKQLPDWYICFFLSLCATASVIAVNKQLSREMVQSSSPF